VAGCASVGVGVSVGVRDKKRKARCGFRIEPSRNECDRVNEKKNYFFAPLTFAFLSPECPWNVRVGANSPSL